MISRRTNTLRAAGSPRSKNDIYRRLPRRCLRHLLAM